VDIDLKRLIRRVGREVVRHVAIAAEDRRVVSFAELRIAVLLKATAPRPTPAILAAVALASTALRTSIAASARKSPSSVRPKGSTAK
jgi:hypothetical protein